MDVNKVLESLRYERAHIEEVFASLEKLALARLARDARRHGGPPDYNGSGGGRISGGGAWKPNPRALNRDRKRKPKFPNNITSRG